MAILKLTIEIPVSDTDGARFYNDSTNAMAGDISCLVNVEEVLKHIATKADFQVLDTMKELSENLNTYKISLSAKPKPRLEIHIS